MTETTNEIYCKAITDTIECSKTPRITLSELKKEDLTFVQLLLSFALFILLYRFLFGFSRPEDDTREGGTSGH